MSCRPPAGRRSARPLPVRRAALLGLIGLISVVGLLGRPLPVSATTPLLDFSPAEVTRILQHGPWPPPPAPDAGNPLAGRPAAIALGQRLFFEPRLSPDGRLACASCHAPAQAFADGLPRSVGRSTLLNRNAPSLWNAAHQRWHGWDGAADSLWSQALRPLLDPREMASSATHIAQFIASDADLRCRYRHSTGRWPATNAQASAPDPAAGSGSNTRALATPAERTLVDASRAIGAFVATLVSGRTPFDHFRDALARGDRQAAAAYPLPAQRGLRLFIGPGRCSSCHVGPLFSNGEFGDIGRPFFVRTGVVDPGRHGGIVALRASPYNLLGAWSNADEAAQLKTRHVALQHRNFGEFKVPSLRNVAHTAPYTHDGQLAALSDVVQHYSQLNLERLHADGEQLLQPLNLDNSQRTDLLAFLHTLSDSAASAWQAPPMRPCAPVMRR